MSKHHVDSRQRADDLGGGNDIEVQSQYLSRESQPEQHRFVYAYTIRIKNNGRDSCQLIARHWMITESDFTVQEVHGEGVVGLRPIIAAGEAFEYSSFAVLKSEVGTMKGMYDMVAGNGDVFVVAVPQFTLCVPRVLQ